MAIIRCPAAGARGRRATEGQKHDICLL